MRVEDQSVSGVYVGGQESDDALPTRVVVATESARSPRHVFAPCIHVSSTGDYLLVCRWDTRGVEEGDATNEQALFVSRDRGVTWIMACDGHPAITLAQGTSFDAPSAITHASVFESATGETSLYYTINQPFTWGKDRPDRSTGGGEIRRVRLLRDAEGAWSTVPASEVVWGFQAPLPDGEGGWCTDIRAISWNGALCCSNGVWLMPIGGRSSVVRPRGKFARLNRVWMLASRDGGNSWAAEAFVGGDDDLCLAEPTIVETGSPGEIVCLMRVQYGTGNELYQSISRDFGRTWTPPKPTGLPNADTQGVKPFLFRARDARVWLIQTNEHESVSRTNIAIFGTDDAGLRACSWQLVRTLHIGHGVGWWPGCCYGWLAEDACERVLVAAFVTCGERRIEIRVARLRPAALLDAPGVEPNGVRDDESDDRPWQINALDQLPPTYLCPSTRSRLIATGMGRLRGDPGWARFAFAVDRLPATQLFRLFRIAGRNGREVGLELTLQPTGHLTLGFGRQSVTSKRSWPDARWHNVECRWTGGQVLVEIDREEVGAGQMTIRLPVTTLLWGGGAVRRDACAIRLGAFAYGSTPNERQT